MGEAFAIKSLTDVGTALYAANQAKNLAEPRVQVASSGLGRAAMTSGGGVTRQGNPYFTAMEQVGKGENAPRFSFVPFQDWFSPPPKRW